MDLLWVQAKMGGVLLCAVLAILALELLGQRARESQSAPLLELVTGMQARREAAAEAEFEPGQSDADADADDGCYS
eukprot:6172288-Pleurochrysis_carterae.AAC.1